MTSLFAVVILLIGEIGDITTTLIDTSRGDIELNPIITGTHMTLPVFIFVKLAPVLILIFTAFYWKTAAIQGLIRNVSLFAAGALFCVTLSNAALMLH